MSDYVAWFFVRFAIGSRCQRLERDFISSKRWRSSCRKTIYDRILFELRGCDSGPIVSSSEISHNGKF